MLQYASYLSLEQTGEQGFDPVLKTEPPKRCVAPREKPGPESLRSISKRHYLVLASGKASGRRSACRFPRERGSEPLRSCPLSERAAWARFTWPATPGSAGTWLSAAAGNPLARSGEARPSREGSSAGRFPESSQHRISSWPRADRPELKRGDEILPSGFLRPMATSCGDCAGFCAQFGANMIMESL